MGARKPLELSTKHLTKSERLKKELMENEKFDDEQLQTLPSWLVDDTAVKEWKRLVKEFGKKSMIGNLDYNNLGAYCNAFAKWVVVTKKLGTTVLIGRQINPLVQLEIKYSDELKKYAVLLGLTAEGKLKKLENRQDSLEKDISKGFGDI
jgi:phage terminase small subunit